MSTESWSSEFSHSGYILLQYPLALIWGTWSIWNALRSFNPGYTHVVPHVDTLCGLLSAQLSVYRERMQHFLEGILS
jgi:hypothetical protein